MLSEQEYPGTEEKGDPLTHEDDLDEDRQWQARQYFPNLVVAPRESDEYPTFWEGQ